MDEEKIKLAFQKAKQDIQELKESLSSLNSEISDIKSLLNHLSNSQTVQQTDDSLSLSQNSSYSDTFIPNKLTEPYKQAQYSPLTLNSQVSIGNEGVPADRQTNRQTDRQPELSTKKDLKEVINSLENIKNEIKSSLSSLTKQEFLIFTTIYQLEEEGFIVDYPLVSKKLSLTESSIRDYVQKLIKKQVPLEKIRENNKKIYLKIPQEFRKVSTLHTLLKLQDLKSN